MRTLLVYPRYGWMEPTIHPAAPLGVAYLASALAREGIEVDIHDITWDKNLGPFKSHLMDYQPDVIGMYCISHNMDYVYDLVPRIRRLMPRSKIIAGGPHATVMPEECGFADCIIKGEAEITMPKVIKSGTIKGIHQGELPELDGLWPYRDLLPMKEYLSIPFIEPMPYPTTNIITSRGCYFKCKFCYPLSDKIFCRPRNRQAKDVAAEIRSLIDSYNVKGIDIEDDLFVFSEKNVREFAQEVKDQGLEFKWRCNSRVDTIDEKKAKYMAESGCIKVIFGVESGSQEMLDKMSKGTNVEQIKKAVKICQDHGIITMCNYVIGFPGETRETLKETFDLIEELKSDIVDVNVANPMPGSWLYDYCKDNDLLQIKDYKDYERGVGGIKLEHFTEKEIQAARDHAYKIYYGYLFKNMRPHFINAMIYRTLTLTRRPQYLTQLMINYLKAIVTGKERERVK